MVHRSFILHLIPGVMVENKTLARLHSTGRDLEFLFYVDQDRGAGSGSDHAGRLPRALRAVLRRRCHFYPARSIVAQLQGMVPPFGAGTYQRSHSFLPDFMG